MTRDEITKAADNFFEWPTDNHDTVTLTSCIFFAEFILAENAKKETTPSVDEIINVVMGHDCRGGLRRVGITCHTVATNLRNLFVAKRAGK